MCPNQYIPLTTSWGECRKAAISLGFSGNSIQDAGYEYAWGNSRPKGCFKSDGNGMIHFNRGQGGSFQGSDAILCAYVKPGKY